MNKNPREQRSNNDRCVAVTLSHFKLMRIVGRGAFGKVQRENTLRPPMQRYSQCLG